MRRLLIIAAATAALSLTVAGCGPETAGETNTNAGGKQASCGLATPSLIKQTLGLDVADPSPTENGSVLVCTYSPVPGATNTVLVRFDTASSADQFKATRDTYPDHELQTANFPGFVDEAYTNTISAIGITTNTLVARKGTVEILVSSSASFEQEKSLEQKLFDGLA